MLHLRLATAAVAIPTLIALIFLAPNWGFALFVGTAASLAVVEYMMLALAEHKRDRWFYSILGVVAVIGWASRGLDLFGPLIDDQLPNAGLALLLSGGLLWVLLARPDFEAGLADLGRALLGVLYGGFLLLHFVWLQELPGGPYWVFFVIMTAMMGDSAGYFVGHAYGRHKLLPRVSPGKTVEGALGIVGGNLLSALVAKAMMAWLPWLPQLGWIEILALAIAQGVLGQLGDLCESMIKRTHGAKDSGKLFPGHGGILDRIDSLVFPVAGVYYYVALCR